MDQDAVAAQFTSLEFYLENSKSEPRICRRRAFHSTVDSNQTKSRGIIALNHPRFALIFFPNERGFYQLAAHLSLTKASFVAH